MTDPNTTDMATIAILLPPKALPTILHQDTPKALLDEIRALPFVPENVTTLRSAAEWLSAQAAPAGLYMTLDDARQAAARAAQAPTPPPEIDGADVQRVRKALGLTRYDFGLRLGYQGNSNTVHKTIYRVETNERSFGPAVAARFVQLAAEAGVNLAGSN